MNGILERRGEIKGVIKAPVGSVLTGVEYTFTPVYKSIVPIEGAVVHGRPNLATDIYDFVGRTWGLVQRWSGGDEFAEIDYLQRFGDEGVSLRDRMLEEGMVYDKPTEKYVRNYLNQRGIDGLQADSVARAYRKIFSLPEEE